MTDNTPDDNVLDSAVILVAETLSHQEVIC